MPTRIVRGAVSASLLVGAVLPLAAGCGQQHPGDGPRPSRSSGGPPSGASPGSSGGASPSPHGGRIDSGLAYVTSTSGGVPEVHTVVRDRAGLDAFARHFGKRADAITAEARNTDFSRSALVGWSTTTGCARWPSATLKRSGDRLALIPGRHPSPPPECFAPFHLIAVFVVPKERLPSEPVFS
ncbi:hypothetical protein [Streptomyces sp. NPDC048636]|uniref:hypothetical protein n=1 Tax=Streptomyces sp. NPDC048636 TaxID=3155762 RepID=UPI00341C305F